MDGAMNNTVNALDNATIMPGTVDDWMGDADIWRIVARAVSKYMTLA